MGKEKKAVTVSTGYTAGSQYSSAYCYVKHAPKPIFTMDQITYYGASESAVGSFRGVIVSLNGGSYVDSNVIQVDEGFEPLLKCIPKEPDIIVDWRDFGIPPFDNNFWAELHNILKARKEDKCLFYCQGGHGRTGTALASMLIALCGDSPKEAARHVRNIYCDGAIETVGQEAYLNRLDLELNPDIKRKKSELLDVSSTTSKYTPSKPKNQTVAASSSDDLIAVDSWWTEIDGANYGYVVRKIIDKDLIEVQEWNGSPYALGKSYTYNISALKEEYKPMDPPEGMGDPL